MNALKNIAERAAEKNLPFLVIGGHAVVAHGYPRQTFDLDIVIPRKDADNWRILAAGLSYVFHGEGPAFLQFNHADLESQPLDIMLVNDQTFAKFEKEAILSPSRNGDFRIVALFHLIALKCHAVKYGHERRIVKDADDVIRLMQANRLNPDDQEIQAVFLKHGTNDFYERVRQACKAD